MKTFAVLVGLILFPMGNLAAAGTWANLDRPGSAATALYGISGNYIIGQNFYYDGTNWVNLQAPTGWSSITVNGIDSNYIVGNCGQSGFIYDYHTNTWSQPPLLERDSTQKICGVQGNQLVGYIRLYFESENYHGTYFNGTSWRYITPTGSWSTFVSAIDGTNAAGYYYKDGNYSRMHGFIYNLATNGSVTLDYPGAISTRVTDIFGQKAVGYYIDSDNKTHGFLYDGANWTTLDAPASTWTYLYGIDGDKIVGYYKSSLDSVQHGCVYTVPEPGCLVLLGLGWLSLRRRLKKRHS